MKVLKKVFSLQAHLVKYYIKLSNIFLRLDQKICYNENQIWEGLKFPKTGSGVIIKLIE